MSASVRMMTRRRMYNADDANGTLFFWVFLVTFFHGDYVRCCNIYIYTPNPGNIPYDRTIHTYIHTGNMTLCIVMDGGRHHLQQRAKGYK